MNNPRYHFLINTPKKTNYQKMNGMGYGEDGGSAGMVNGPMRTEDPAVPGEIYVFNYVCTGKLTLFPAIIMSLGCGSGWLLTFGKGYNEGYFEWEYKYGIVGAILLVATMALLSSLLIWLVLRVSFIITPTQFKIMKSGLLRSSTLEFDINSISLHYCRTHFIEEKSWLQLVVKEDDQFYQIFSWKGKGNQKERFQKLFTSLKKKVKEVQLRKNCILPKMNAEIVSTKERNLIGPFADRLRQISSTSTNVEQPLCIEDLPLVSYDSFFNHFKLNKKLDMDYDVE